MTTTDQLDAVMQAAERLRRLEASHDVRDVYPHGTAPWVEVRADRDRLAEFALAILPGLMEAHAAHTAAAKRCNFERCGCEYCNPINWPAGKSMPTSFAVR